MRRFLGQILKLNMNKICYLLGHNESGLEVDKFHQNLERVERAPWQLFNVHIPWLHEQTNGFN